MVLDEKRNRRRPRLCVNAALPLEIQENGDLFDDPFTLSTEKTGYSSMATLSPFTVYSYEPFMRTFGFAPFSRARLTRSRSSMFREAISASSGPFSTALDLPNATGISTPPFGVA
jgi:hypothetical protein